MVPLSQEQLGVLHLAPERYEGTSTLCLQLRVGMGVFRSSSEHYDGT